MEVYESLKNKQHKKKYLVFELKQGTHMRDLNNVEKTATKFFHCSSTHIWITTGWICNDLLYFDDPHKKGKKKVLIAYWLP